MIWSLTRILAFVGLTAVIAYGVSLLMETNGEMRLIALGYEITVGPIQAAVLIAAILMILWIILRLIGLSVALLRFVNGDETAISRYFNRNRERRGFEALADGMMALASGEGRLAMAKAARAEKFLARPELTNLLAAQAAEMAGDKDKAQEVYRRLLKDDRTKFVGLRGIMKQKLAEGDSDTALKLAERAFSLKPHHDETGDVLLHLQADNGDWAGARQTLGAKLKSGALPRDVHRRRDAVLALAQVDQDSDGADATTQAQEANRLSPELVPAAVEAARGFIAEGKKRAAIKAIRKAWDAQPHPDLIAVFAEVEPDEEIAARRARYSILFNAQPNHPETKFAQAELALIAEDFDEATSVLDSLQEVEPSARTLALRAAIARGQGADDSIVETFLTRALSAPRGATWVCDNCQTVSADWVPVCGNCSALDTLSWRVPPVAVRPAPQQEILPPPVQDETQSAAETAPAEIELLPDESVEIDIETDPEGTNDKRD